VLKGTSFEFGIQESLTSVMFVIAALLMTRYYNILREGQWFVLCFIVMGVVDIVYSQLSIIWLAIAIQAAGGMASSPYAIARQLIIQRHTPREMRGRVNSGFMLSQNLFYIVGMVIAGLADVVDVRWVFFGCGVLLLGIGVYTMVLPGLREDMADWKRMLGLLRSAKPASTFQPGRAATLADLNALVGLLPALSVLNREDRQALAGKSRVVDAPEGTTLVACGETGDCAYFILSGKAAAGIAEKDGAYRSLSTMLPGDWFGEIAALTGSRRTATVVSAEPIRLLQVHQDALRQMMAQPPISAMFLSKMTQRLARTSLTDLPRFAGLDQRAIHELREGEVA
jgi:CRP-like cAMP-binding protein